MSISLSASSIKDFLVCPARHYFRLNYSEQSLQTFDIVSGNIVHKVIETYWNDEKNGISLAEKLIKESEIKDNKVMRCLGNFYNREYPISDGDMVEKYFKVNYTKGVDIVGRIDRISDGVIFDWKTAVRPPTNIDNDIQFIIYYVSYKKMFGKFPSSVYYVSLYEDKLIKFKPNIYYINMLYDELIPYIIREVKGNHFYKKGVFDKYSCSTCLYRDICRSEENGMVD